MEINSDWILGAAFALGLGGYLYYLFWKGKKVSRLVKSFEPELQLLGLRVTELYIPKKASELYLDKCSREVSLNDDMSSGRGSSYKRIHDIFDVGGKDIDYIFHAEIVISHSRSSQYDDYMEYIVCGQAPGWEETPSITKTIWSPKKLIKRLGEKDWRSGEYDLEQLETRLVIARGGTMTKPTAVDAKWEGDEELAQRLNSDDKLKSGIMESYNRSVLLERGTVCYEPKYGFAVIRTNVVVPTTEDFETLNAIARHIKAAWFD